MKTLYLIGAVLTLAACAQQQPPPPVAAAPPPPPPVAMAPPPPPSAPMLASLDGVYAGSLTLTSSGLSNQDLNRTGLRVGATRSRFGPPRPHQPRIRQLERHKLHYKGRVDANGTVTAYHKNSDGSSSILNAQISNGQLTGNMDRGPCSYAVALAMR